MARNASTSEVAAALGISSATVQRYAREGRIPFSETPGGHRRFDVGEVRRVLGGDRGAIGATRERAQAVVLTALDVEFGAVIAHLSDVGVRRLPNGTRYHSGHFAGHAIDWDVAVAEIGEGNITAAAETTRAIEVFKPDVVLFVGVGGGLKPEIPHGSVVVATKVYRYHSGKASQDFLARPMTFPTWHGLEQLVREVRRSHWTTRDPKPIVELKPIAAGEVVLASRDSEVFRLLHEHCNDAVAVDMESAGMYEAAHRAGGRAVLTVRGISDLLEDKSASSDYEWQPAAAENAAAFAFALLREAHPGDVGLASAANPFATERAELLASVPPPAAAVLQAVLDDSDGLPVLRRLADRRHSPRQIVEELLTTKVIDSSRERSADLWHAVGEFAVAHALHEFASELFEQAAQRASKDVGRLLARAALAAGAADQRDRANQLIADAAAKAVGSQEVSFVEVIASALSEDPDRVEEATRRYGAGDGLVDLMRVHALRSLNRVDEALNVGLSSIADHPNRSLTGGMVLEVARLLLARCGQVGAGSPATHDADRSRAYALQARDLRRQWGGPSAEAAAVAASAAGTAGDFAAVFAIALPPPEGEATDEEAADPELAALAANAALASGDMKRAQTLARRIPDQAERLLVEADCAEADGAPSEAVVRIRQEALREASTPWQRFRAYVGLASTGVWPLEGFEGYAEEDAAGSEIAHAAAELASGKRDAALRRLRSVSDERALGLLIEAYLDSDRVDDAVDTLRDAAQRFGRPYFRVRVASLLASQGRFDEALREATDALLHLPTDSSAHLEVRHLCVELAARLQDWTGMVDHARAAILEGSTEAAIQWALIGGLFNNRDLDEARRELLESGVEPRNEDEAGLAIQLLRTGETGSRTVATILDVAERFPESEVIAASAFAAAMEVARELELPGDIANRLAQLSSGFFERWPESKIVTRIDVSDLDNLVEFMRQHFAPAAGELEKLAAGVMAGELPYGLITAARGRPLAAALVTNALGCIPIGSRNLQAFEREHQAARQALDGVVVADTHALVVLGRTGIDPSSVTAAFSKIIVERHTIDDLLETVDSLRLRSTASMGWDPKRDRPVLVEFDEDEADRWAREADQLLDRARQFRVRSVTRRRLEGATGDVVEVSQDDTRIRVILGPVELAKQLGCALWSDDPAVREVARNEGVATFGMVSLVEVLAESGGLGNEDLESARRNLIAHCFVDLPFEPEIVLAVAEAEGWTGRSAAWALTRPLAWKDPLAVLGVYRSAVSRAAEEAPDQLSNWSTAAGLGAARSVSPERRNGAVATVVLSGFFQTGSDPRFLPPLVDGARAAAAAVGLDDPLPHVARLLREALSAELGEDAVPQVFSTFISELTDDDRATALTVLIAP